MNGLAQLRFTTTVAQADDRSLSKWSTEEDEVGLWVVESHEGHRSLHPPPKPKALPLESVLTYSSFSGSFQAFVQHCAAQNSMKLWRTFLIPLTQQKPTLMSRGANQNINRYSLINENQLCNSPVHYILLVHCRKTQK